MAATTAGEHVAVWDGTQWVSIRGEKGEPGKALSIRGVKPTAADLPLPGVEGDLWIVAADGSGYVWEPTATPPAYVNIGRIQGPDGQQGIKGEKGDKGDTGAAGTTPIITIGTVTTGAAGSAAAVTNSGTTTAARLNFTLPQGAKGDAGPAGSMPVLSAGTTKTLAAGQDATVAIKSSTAGVYTLDLGIPQGASSTVAIGSVTTGAAGSAAAVTNGGTASAAVLNYTIPKGDAGADGAAGPAGPAGPQAVSTDAGNLTKLGTDGKVFTAVKASDVTGLGTIATKSTNDYLPTGGGVLQGPVGLTSLTGPSAYLAADVADTAEVQIVANGRDAFLELTTKTTGGIEAGWQLRADANGLLTTQAVNGAAGANGITPLSINFAAYNATLGDRVTVGFPAFFERNVTAQNTAGNSSVFTIAAPTGVDASFRLVANKSGVPSIEWRTAGEDWVVSAQVNNQLLIGTTTQPGGIGLMRTSTDTDATARITLGWGTHLTGSVMSGVKFGAQSVFADRLDAYEEGNWVPAYTADTQPSVTYSVQAGTYTRVGRLVTVTGYLQAGSIVSPLSSVNALRIAGLPFPRQTATLGVGSVGLANGWGTARPMGLFADGTLGLNEIGMYDSAAHTGGSLPLLTGDKMGADCLLMFEFTYFTTT